MNISVYWLERFLTVLETWSIIESRKKSVGQFRCSVVSDSLWPHGLQHARLSCSSPTPGACSDSCPSSQWCHPTILSTAIPFSSCINLPQHQGLFQWVSSSHQVAKVLKFQLQHQSFQEYSVLISFRIYWFELLAVQRTQESSWFLNLLETQRSQESSPTLQFKSISSSVLSFLYSILHSKLHYILSTLHTKLLIHWLLNTLYFADISSRFSFLLKYVFTIFGDTCWDSCMG